MRLGAYMTWFRSSAVWANLLRALLNRPFVLSGPFYGLSSLHMQHCCSQSRRKPLTWPPLRFPYRVRSPFRIVLYCMLQQMYRAFSQPLTRYRCMFGDSTQWWSVWRTTIIRKSWSTVTKIYWSECVRLAVQTITFYAQYGVNNTKYITLGFFNLINMCIIYSSWVNVLNRSVNT